MTELINGLIYLLCIVTPNDSFDVPFIDIRATIGLHQLRYASLYRMQEFWKEKERLAPAVSRVLSIRIPYPRPVQHAMYRRISSQLKTFQL